MDLALSPEDTDLAGALSTLLANDSSPARVRAAEKLGFDPVLWGNLNAFGVPSLAAGTTADAATMQQLALVAGQSGRHLASAPVVESLVTTRLLSRCPGEAADGLLARVLSGSVATLVLHPTNRATAPLVPAGAVADIVLHYDGSDLKAVVNRPPMVASPNLGDLPLADRDLSSGDTALLASGDTARELFVTAQRDWQLLTAAQLVGLAGRALEIGVDNVKGRIIFDRPVGAFQTVAHRLADQATNLDGAQLLVQEGAWAVDVSDSRAGGLAKMAFCFAAEQALAIAGDSLHYHGGYGFSLEYDIQLFYRRARAYPLVWGSVKQEFQALADELFSDAGTNRDGYS